MERVPLCEWQPSTLEGLSVQGWESGLPPHSVTRSQGHWCPLKDGPSLPPLSAMATSSSWVSPAAANRTYATRLLSACVLAEQTAVFSFY